MLHVPSVTNTKTTSLFDKEETVTELEKLFRLTVHVFCDCVPGRPLPTYLVGETADNEESVFAAACTCAGEYPIIINGGDDTAGYPSGTVWAGRVWERYHVAPERIHLVPHEGPPNTRTEMLSLAEYLKLQQWKEIVMVAAPFHQVRAFLTLLRALQEKGLDQVRLYSRVGSPQPWGEVALHSQGVVRATRAELVGGEFGRIERYTALGHLATLDEALEYLRQRDA